mgnify:FL=1
MKYYKFEVFMNVEDVPREWAKRFRCAAEPIGTPDRDGDQLFKFTGTYGNVRNFLADIRGFALGDPEFKEIAKNYITRSRTD